MLQSCILRVRTISLRFSCMLRLSKIGLESVYTDFVIVRRRWMEFITRLQSEWTEFTLYASIPQSCTATWLMGPIFIVHRVAECQRGTLGFTKR